ncbi:MAG: hypothetical protein Q7S21_03660 [archaeon]|nr:hypothetical protein [archaeon]
MNRKTCIPHISLCMGVIDETSLPEIKIVIDKIAKDFSELELAAESIYAKTIPTGKIISNLQIRNNAQLQKLHETIMKKLLKYLSYGVEESMFSNPKEVEEPTLYWVKNYAKHFTNSSSFHPHITIGFGEANKFKFPIKFTTSKLVLCQLGNLCTCKKFLVSSNLKKE